MDKKGFSSRLKFVKSKNVVGENAYAWSFINDEERFVIFGAWRHAKTKQGNVIFSDKWIRKENGHRNPGYTMSIPHIEKIIEENYQLYTFPQVAKPGTETGTAVIGDWKAELTEKKLVKIGFDYVAVDLTSDLLGEQASGEIEHWEGKSKQVIETHYERNPEARAACLAKKGYVCEVCDFNFEKAYGAIGEKYIHVHHTVRVADRKRPYKVNPTKDLVPLCPNCHAMIHKRIPPYSTSELKEIMREADSP